MRRPDTALDQAVGLPSFAPSQFASRRFVCSRARARASPLAALDGRPLGRACARGRCAQPVKSNVGPSKYHIAILISRRRLRRLASSSLTTQCSSSTIQRRRHCGISSPESRNSQRIERETPAGWRCFAQEHKAAAAPAVAAAAAAHKIFLTHKHTNLFKCNSSPLLPFEHKLKLSARAQTQAHTRDASNHSFGRNKKHSRSFQLTSRPKSPPPPHL